MHFQRTLITGLVAVALILAFAGPAAAKKYGVEQSGRGSWDHIAGGVSFTGTTIGSPVEGETVGTIATLDGTLPPWPGCEDATGTMTTTDGRTTLVVEIRGSLCLAVAPSGYLVFRGWYDVVEYTGARGRRVADGTGSLSMEFLADGYGQWMAIGDLY
jgi:hypothetical protein